MGTLAWGSFTPTLWGGWGEGSRGRGGEPPPRGSSPSLSPGPDTLICNLFVYKYPKLQTWLRFCHSLRAFFLQQTSEPPFASFGPLSVRSGTQSSTFDPIMTLSAICT
jgi:hypothetical protein